MMNDLPESITAYLIKERDSVYASPVNAIEGEQIVDWYANHQYWIWLNETNCFNRDKNISAGNTVRSALAKFKQVNFTIQNSDSVDTDRIFMSYNTRSGLIKFEIMLPFSKPAVTMCLETSNYFNALLSLNADGIMDSNYLKLFSIDA